MHNLATSHNESYIFTSFALHNFCYLSDEFKVFDVLK